MAGIHSGQFDSQKISKIGATSCKILRLKCTNIDFGLAVFKGPTSKRKVGKGKDRREREGGGRERGGERKGENHLTHPLSQIPGYATALSSWKITRQKPGMCMAEARHNNRK